MLNSWLTMWLEARVQHSYIPFWHFDRHQAISSQLCPASSAILLHFSLLLDQRRTRTRYEDRENGKYVKDAITKGFTAHSYVTSVTQHLLNVSCWMTVQHFVTDWPKAVTNERIVLGTKGGWPLVSEALLRKSVSSHKGYLSHWGYRSKLAYQHY